ncbi:MAG: hypothetical protein EBU66_10420 [Bacteroidetes bacterium]|nr:hypothetical protein [Bacteroidota bacterium]
MNGFVLKSNAMYQHISKVKQGEYVMNKYGLPTKVKKIYQQKYSRKRPLMSVQHTLWYEPTICHQDCNILTWDGFQTMWGHYEDLGNYIATPSIFNWDIPDTFSHFHPPITPSYELGYIFGCYTQTYHTV